MFILYSVKLLSLAPEHLDLKNSVKAHFQQFMTAFLYYTISKTTVLAENKKILNLNRNRESGLL